MNYREQEIIKELSAIASQETEDGLFLQFQPILHLESNKICGFEALARLNSEKIGSVSPLEFIPIAEKTKLIIPIGKKVTLLALNFLKKLEIDGHNDINIIIEELKEHNVKIAIDDFGTGYSSLAREGELKKKSKRNIWKNVIVKVLSFYIFWINFNYIVILYNTNCFCNSLYISIYCH